MKIERLIDEGLMLSREDQQLSFNTQTTSRDDGRLDLRGQDIGQKVDSSSMDEPKSSQSPLRRSSTMEEFQRQSGVFFDDPEADCEDTDDSVDGDSIK